LVRDHYITPAVQVRCGADHTDFHRFRQPSQWRLCVLRWPEPHWPFRPS